MIFFNCLNKAGIFLNHIKVGLIMDEQILGTILIWLIQRGHNI